MKTLFLIFFSLFIWNTASSQNVFPASLFQDAIFSYRDTNHIYYMDSAMLQYRNFSYYTKKNKIEGQLDLKTNQYHYLKFSKKEIKELNSEFLNQSPTRWPDQFFKNSTRLTIDSLKGFTKYLNTSDTNRQYKFYYYFSPIAFTRDSSIAIFRMAEMISPSAGYDFLYIYSKENEIWKRKLAKHIGSW